MSANKKTQYDLMRAKVMRERTRKLQIDQFTPTARSIRGRVAEFLLRCVETHPREFVTYEEITQAIFSLGRAPDPRSKYVKSVRGQMSSAGQLLLEQHSKTLITCRGVGVRASVDNIDKTERSMTKEADNYRAALKRLAAVSRSIDQLQLSEEIQAVIDPGYREDLEVLAEWFQELQQNITKQFKPAAQRALLPPAARAS